MWHVRAEIAPAVLLVVDFGGWYKLDSKASNSSSSDMIQHTQVSLLKDVIVPYTHLLPMLLLSENQKRETLLYFKGAKHRHRVSIQFYKSILWENIIVPYTHLLPIMVSAHSFNMIEYISVNL